MEIDITKMSANGQIVIPSEIRKKAGLKPSTKFLIINEGGNILLKQLNEESLKEELKLIKDIALSEKDIKAGRVVKTKSSDSFEKVDALLMG